MEKAGKLRHIRALCMLLLIVCSLAFSPVTSVTVTYASTKTSASARAKKKKAAKASKTAKTKKKKTTVKKGFVKKNGRWYYYNEQGKLQTGWIRVGSATYYGKKSGSHAGALVTGWVRSGGREYYFRRSGGKGKTGMMYTGTQKVNGISCHFTDEGVFTGCTHAGSRRGFINRVGEMARENQRKHNILATVVVAQACLETGYGRVVPGNNLFGLYGKRFSSWQGSFEGYNAYIRRYFPRLVGVRSYVRYASTIGSGGYAAAGNYGQSLLWIIRRYNLTKFAR